jgi:hypothetical protein
MIGRLKRGAQKVSGALYRDDYPKLIKLGAIERPHYAYIVYQAADLARRLKLSRISVLEFGVAGGRGLLNLEHHAARVGALTGVAIEVYGFDTGEGLPPPVDFKMDQAALKAKLKSAKLVLGDVKQTTPTFAADFKPAPIGAISFDLDYYSSTLDAFGVLTVPSEFRLPRIFVYFDDIFSSDLGHVGPGAGVPLAIDEFNAADPQRRLSPLTHLEFAYRPARAWHRQIYSYADFKHPLANQYIVGQDRQLSL